MQTRLLIGLCLGSSIAFAGCAEKDDGATGSNSAGDDSADDDDDDGSGSADDDNGDDDDDDGSGSQEGNDDSAESPDDDGGSEAADTAEETAGDDEMVGFIQDPDGGGVNIECDVWAQDCMDGEKCMPWANDGGGAWNATRCSPLDDNPSQVGDPCTVEGSGVSGIDNCDISSMCWDVDPETNMGTCIAFCSGSEANPVCEDPTTSCVITNEGTLILCLPNCDPLLQDCAEGQACYPVGDSFACAPDASQDTGAYGDACEFINVCDPGLMCGAPEWVPGCAGAGCCTDICDVSDADASANCPGNAGGQECVAWYEEGQAPPGFENVGVCSIPA
jgi:hypothetical protein